MDGNTGNGAEPKGGDPAATTILWIRLEAGATRRHMVGAMGTIGLAMFGLLLNVIVFQDFLITYCGVPEDGVSSSRGYLAILYNLVYLATAPFWGILSDRFGRRRVAALCLACTAGSFCLLGMARSFWGVAGVHLGIGFFASGGMSSAMAAA
ncbi:MAG: MFS transporter, partial [Planctomycetota bacterium]